MSVFSILAACKLAPPSPAAALLLLNWLYGTAGPGVSYEDYRDLYRKMAGPEQTALAEKCWGQWPVKPEKH